MESGRQARVIFLMMMPELEAIKRISAYIAKNKLNSALEAETENMVVEANNSQVPEEGTILVMEPKSPYKQKNG